MAFPLIGKFYWCHLELPKNRGQTKLREWKAVTFIEGPPHTLRADKAPPTGATPKVDPKRVMGFHTFISSVYLHIGD